MEINSKGAGPGMPKQVHHPGPHLPLLFDLLEFDNFFRSWIGFRLQLFLCGVLFAALFTDLWHVPSYAECSDSGPSPWKSRGESIRLSSASSTCRLVMIPTPSSLSEVAAFAFSR